MGLTYVYECNCGAVLTERQRASHEMREQHQEYLKTLPDYKPVEKNVRCRCGGCYTIHHGKQDKIRHEKTQIHQLHISINPYPYLEV